MVLEYSIALVSNRADLVLFFIPEKGEAERLSMRFAPPIACSFIGPEGTQRSSQIFIPIFASPYLTSKGWLPGEKYLLSSNTE